MGGPISPDDVAGLKWTVIPPEVFEVFNEMIAASYVGGQAIVYQHAAAKLVCERMGVTEQEIFEKHWFDVEEAYRAVGWSVVYDRPAFNESYPASFRFTGK